MILSNLVHECVEIGHTVDGLLQDPIGHDAGEQSKGGTLCLTLSLWARVRLVYNAC